jgi:hypothetical protein
MATFIHSWNPVSSSRCQIGLTVYLVLHDQVEKKEVSNLLDYIFCGEQPRELIGNKETILATKSSNHAIKR